MFKRIIFGAVTVLLTAFAQGVNTANAEIGDPELVTSFVWDRIESIRERDSGIGAASDLTSSLQIGIAWDTRDVYPGHDIAVSVTITSGVTPASDIPRSFDLGLEIKLYQADMDQLEQSSLILVPTYTKTVADGLKSGVTTQFPAFRAPVEGSYRLKTTLTITREGQILAKKTEERTFIVRSALPPGLAQLFSGLALFAAVMAIMAAGTEVIIESIKLAVGLKQKPTAMEAFEQLKNELPGQLANLGVTAPWRKEAQELKDYVTHESGRLRAALSPRFPGVVEIPKTVNALFENLKGADNKKTLELKEAANKSLESLKENLQRQFDRELPEFEKLKSDIGELVNANAPEKRKNVERFFHDMQSEIPERISEWLKGQIDKYHSDPEGSRVVKTNIDNGIVPLLEELGFEKETSKRAGNELKRQINGIWRLDQDNVSLFVSATQELLREVANTREKVQSPLRKFWRWINDDQSKGRLIAGLFASSFIGGIAGWVASEQARQLTIALFITPILILVGSAGVIMLIVAIPGDTLRRHPLPAIASSIASCLEKSGCHKVLWLLATQLPLILFLCVVSQQLQVVVRAELGIAVGSGLALLIRYIATITGQRAKEKTETEERLSGLTPSTLAATLLQQEEKHQDEETSRVRIMRIISIIVGCILAYAVEIDAIEILGQALPGIQVANPILGWVNQPFLGLVPLQHNLTAGMLLSGLAASAGSKFWRDFLGRLEAGKQQAEEAAIAIRRAKRALGQDEPQ